MTCTVYAYRSARLIIGMIVASWIISTVISIPPLFGLKDPDVDDSAFQTSTSRTNGTDVDRQRPPPLGDIPLSQERDAAALDDAEFSYSDQYDDISSGDYRLIYADEAANETSSFDLEEVNCLISQNLVCSVFPLLTISKNNDKKRRTGEACD